MKQRFTASSLHANCEFLLTSGPPTGSRILCGKLCCIEVYYLPIYFILIGVKEVTYSELVFTASAINFTVNTLYMLMISKTDSLCYTGGRERLQQCITRTKESKLSTSLLIGVLLETV